MRKSFKQVVSGLLAAALLLPGGLIAPAVSAADLVATNSQIVYQETFQNGQGKATQSGGAQLDAVTGKSFEGNDDGAALHVSNRSNNWDGVDLAFDDLGLSVGKEYSVTASVYVDSDANPPADGKAVLEIVSNKGVDGSEAYTGISSADFKAGQGITLSADLSVNSVENTALRIKSDEAGKGVSFYIGDITITQTVTPVEPTVVLNQSFEDGNTGGWGKLGWGSNGDTAVVNDVASEGTKSLKFFNRADEKAVPALVLTGKMKSDRKYDISLKVRLGSGEGQFHLASKIDSEILSDGQKYPWIIGNKLVTAAEWTLFETKGYEVPSKTNEVIIYVEPFENTLTSDIYIDEVMITDVTPDQTTPEIIDKTGIATDFENGLDGFKARNGRETVVLSQDDNHTSGGKQSLLVTTTTQYDAALVNADGKMAKNHEYELSAWVKMAPGQSPTTLRISVQYADSGFANVSPNATVTDQEWVHLTGKYTLTTTPSVLNAYIETANNDGGNRTFFLDDFALKYVGPVAAAPPIQENLPNLKDIYEDDFLIGNIVNPATFDETRLKLLTKHHNVVTFENDMKPDYAYNADRQFDFTAEDALVQRVKNAGLDLHGHVLVWHAQSPTWLHTAANGEPLSREEALTNLRTHVKTVVEHFGDQVISWDVVNEAMNDNPSNPQDWKNALRNSGWLQAIGPDFLEEAFLAAKEVIDENGWDIKLYYNDYNDDNQNKATAIYSMVKEINEKYAKDHPGEKLIDGIGMQAHYNLGTRLDNVKMSLERFISLGVEVSVTELDIMAGTNSTITEKEAKQQAYLYAQLMDLYKKNSEHIPRVTFWGLNDGTSWRAEQNPTLFDKNFQAKEAFYGVVDPEKYMAENPPEELEYKKSSAHYGTPSIDGSIDSVWSKAPELKLDTKQMAWSGATGTAKALWDENNLYVLVQVRDDQLNKSNPNVWEQDSVEVFVDENNGKTSSFQDDDGQYRVNFENLATFNPAEIAAGFESEVSVSGTNYTVEMKIPFKKVKPANNAKIGFDAQINDAKDGNRISVNAWNDPSGQGYQDTSVFGELTLTGKPSTGGPTPPIQENLPNLKDTYTDDFLMGNIVNPSTFDETRLKLLKKHYNVVTFENDMKPDYAYNADRQFDFTAEDALVQKVKDAGLDLHGHVLVWHAQSPTWLHTAANGEPLSREEALTNLRTHVKTVVEHFGDQVISWDVVNEAMNDNPSNPQDWKNALRNSGWLQAIGPDFLEEAFLAAKEVIDENGWDIKLYYNDYNDDNQNKATAIYSMVKEINEKYAKDHPGEKLIDGIGMQAHYNLGTRLDNVKMSLERFISLGVEVSVTELDIMAGTNSTITEKEAKQQAYLYAQLMDLYKKNSEHIPRVTFWGLNDGTSWRAEQNPTLFDKNFQAKEAFYGVVDPEKYMAENPPEELEFKKSSAHYGTPSIDGSIDSIWSKAPELKLDTKQMAWSGATGTAKALWDENNLYVLVQVRDDQLNKSNPNVWEQDSVEVFVDENNGKTSSFQDDDGQYRVNFENLATFNPAEIAAGFESEVAVSGTNYTVEMKIPFKKVKPANNAKIGFDAQINDAKDGNRISVNAWNDPSGQGYQDTSVFGELTLTGKPSSGGNDGGGNNGGGNNSGGNNGGSSGGSNSGTTPQPQPQPQLPGSDSAIVPVIKVENGTATATISSDSLNKAIDKATPGANGKKQITIDVPKQANAQSYIVQLPTSSLQSSNNVEFVLKTDHATLQIPSNMLSNITEQAGQVSIEINKVSADLLSADVRAIVGSRPVIDLSVKAGDRLLAWNNPAAPVTVSVPYTPAAQELVNAHQIVILYIDNQGQAAAVPSGYYDAKSGSMVFKTTHFSTYAVAYVTKSFADVQHVLWAKEAVEAMAARDIIKGISDDSFAPAASITRADFITLLVRALELKGSGTNTATFSDVQPTAYYAEAVAIAKELGIASGFEDNTFKPGSSISRQDMMVLTAKALKAAGKQSASNGNLAPYSDAASISTYAKDSVASLVGSGIVNGKDGKIAPAESLTRAEAAMILYRIWNM